MLPPWVMQFVQIGAIAVGGWIAHRFTQPKDHERAGLLEKIAEGAAALVVSLYPTADWAVLLKAVVDSIISASGTPTDSRAAIERAAAAALVKLGKGPSK